MVNARVNSVLARLQVYTLLSCPGRIITIMVIVGWVCTVAPTLSSKLLTSLLVIETFSMKASFLMQHETSVAVIRGLAQRKGGLARTHAHIQ